MSVKNDELRTQHKRQRLNHGFSVFKWFYVQWICDKRISLQIVPPLSFAHFSFRLITAVILIIIHFSVQNFKCLGKERQHRPTNVAKWNAAASKRSHTHTQTHGRWQAKRCNDDAHKAASSIVEINQMKRVGFYRHVRTLTILLMPKPAAKRNLIDDIISEWWTFTHPPHARNRIIYA